MIKLFDPAEGTTDGSGAAGLKYLPEGPQLLFNADRKNPSVGWVGIQHGPESEVGSINILDLLTLKNLTIEVPGRPGFFAETNKKNTILDGLTHRLALVNLESKEVQFTKFSVPIESRHIINDGIATPLGLLWGTKATKWMQKDGALYFLPWKNPRVMEIKSEVMCSNGAVVLRAENNFIFFAYIDSPKKTIEEFRLNSETGQLEHLRVIADFNYQAAFPDGMRAAPQAGDTVQRLVVAFFNPGDEEDGVIRELDIESGEVTFEWSTPGAARVTCLTFVPSPKSEISQISILATTADEGMPEEFQAKQQNSGCIFIGETNYDSTLCKPTYVPVDVFE